MKWFEQRQVCRCFISTVIEELLTESHEAIHACVRCTSVLQCGDAHFVAFAFSSACRDRCLVAKPALGGIAAERIRGIGKATE